MFFMIVLFFSRDYIAKPTALFLIVALLLWSCKSKDSKPDQPEGKASYSGEELFRGIMFADGKVAETLPEIKKVQELVGMQSMKENQKKAVKTLQDSIVFRINKIDPDYFKSFQYNISSGNHVVITSAIRNASSVINNIILTSNKGLSQILDERENKLLMARLSASKNLDLLKNYKDSSSLVSTSARDYWINLDRDAIIDKDVLINRITDININKYIDLHLNRDINISRWIDINRDLNVIKALDFDLNRSFDFDINRNFALNRSIDIFRFLDVDRNIQTQFDRVNISLARSNDVDFNPFASVAVDIETAIYAVVAVAVFVVAVAAWVLGRQDILNDKGGIFKEQLVNSIATKLNVPNLKSLEGVNVR